MKSFKELSVRNQLITGFTAIILFMVVVNVTAYLAIRKIISSSEKVYNSDNMAVDLVSIKANLNRSRALILEFTLSKDISSMTSFKNRLNEVVEDNNKLIEQVQAFYTDKPEEAKIFNAALRKLELYRANREKQMDLIQQKKFDEVSALGTGEQNALYNEIRDILKDLGDKANENSRVQKADSLVVASFSNWIILIIGILATLISFFLARTLINIFRRIIHDLHEGISVLSSSSAEILSISTQVSSGATETSSAIAETTTTVEEVRQTAVLANQKAEKVVEISQQATQTAIHGRDSVHEAIDGIKRISMQMNVISDSVIKLSDQSRLIGEITATVNDLADQSNLLAVNASIEAAKAGEQGRGFAVVAQEIRSLSEQSKQATQQVKDILNDIQKAVNQAVMATEQGAKAVEGGTKLAIQSGEVIQLMAESVNEVNQAAIQISVSSQQQITGMEQIVPAMESIKLASDQNVTGTRQTQSAANSLNDLGANLKKIIEKYNV